MSGPAEVRERDRPYDGILATSGSIAERAERAASDFTFQARFLVSLDQCGLAGMVVAFLAALGNDPAPGLASGDQQISRLSGGDSIRQYAGMRNFGHGRSVETSANQLFR